MPVRKVWKPDIRIVDEGTTVDYKIEFATVIATKPTDARRRGKNREK
tara:strand:+ start:774 stop:914 length:141 start_codon:yes stop_codon:yes gene_type:complete